MCIRDRPSVGLVDVVDVQMVRGEVVVQRQPEPRVLRHHVVVSGEDGLRVQRVPTPPDYVESQTRFLSQVMNSFTNNTVVLWPHTLWQVKY